MPTNGDSTPPTPGVYINSDGRKTFVPLENNPKIFTALAHRLGLSPRLAFHDVYSIDDPDLLALVPRPVHALIFISPASVYHSVRASDAGSKTLTYDRSGDEEPVIWFKQTIGHSCGLLALIHSLANGSARSFVERDSLLDRLLAAATPLKPLPRADVLYQSKELEEAHMAFALQGDSVAPRSEEPNGYHFISFVNGKDGRLYELEGSWDGPIDRGSLDEKDDCLSEAALQAGVRRFVKAADGSVEFSIIALATNA